MRSTWIIQPHCVVIRPPNQDYFFDGVGTCIYKLRRVGDGFSFANSSFAVLILSLSLSVEKETRNKKQKQKTKTGKQQQLDNTEWNGANLIATRLKPK